MREGKSQSIVAELTEHWRALIGSTLGVTMGIAALPFYTAGVFVPAMEHEFGWSRSQLASVSVVTTFMMALCAPLAGVVIDRFGVRSPAVFSLIALAAGFASLGSMNGSLGQYAIIQIAILVFGIASTPISFTRAINERFDAARGLALGITLSGTGIAAAIAPPIVAAIITEHGWRVAYWGLAAVVFLSIPPVTLLLKPARRETPPPGNIADRQYSQSQPLISYIVHDTRVQRLLLVFLTLGLGITGFVFHLVPMLTDSGMPMAEAAGVQATLGLAVIAGRLVTGALVDHFFAPRVAAVSLCGTAAGIAALALYGPSAAPWAAFAIGFALGAEVDLIGYLTVRYFGLAAYGRLYGVLYGSFIIGGGLSPLFIATVVSNLGGYSPALWLCVVFIVLAVALLLTAPPFPELAETLGDLKDTRSESPDS